MNHTQLKKWLPALGVVLLFFVFYVLFIAAHEAGHLLALRSVGGDGNIAMTLSSGKTSVTYAPFSINSWQYGLFVIGGGLVGFVILGSIYCVVKRWCDKSVWGVPVTSLIIFYLIVMAGSGILEFLEWRWGLPVYKQSNICAGFLVVIAALAVLFRCEKTANTDPARSRPVPSFLVATALLGLFAVALVGTCPSTSLRPNQVVDVSAQGLNINLTAPSFYGVAGESPQYALSAYDIPPSITTSNYLGSVGERRYFVRAGEPWLLQVTETIPWEGSRQLVVAFYNSDGALVYDNTFEYIPPFVCATFTPPLLANNNYYVLTSVKGDAAGATVTVRGMTTINTF